MAAEQAKTQALSYAARLPRRRQRVGRGAIVALLGTACASIGVVIFLYAHKFAGWDFSHFRGYDSDKFFAEHASLHEVLWSEFGIALLLAGALIAAVGFNSWCKTRDNPTDAADRRE